MNYFWGTPCTALLLALPPATLFPPSSAISFLPFVFCGCHCCLAVWFGGCYSWLWLNHAAWQCLWYLSNLCHGYGFLEGRELPTHTCTYDHLWPQPVWVCKPMTFPTGSRLQWSSPSMGISFWPQAFPGWRRLFGNRIRKDCIEEMENNGLQFFLDCFVCFSLTFLNLSCLVPQRVLLNDSGT